MPVLSAERIEALRRRLSLPKDVFAARVEQAMREARGSDLIEILIRIRQSLEARAPTPRERALVDALLMQVQTGGQRPAICTCIRCGVTASLVATALMGFACCAGCWSRLNRLRGTIDSTGFDVDLLGDTILEMHDITVGTMDGVELV